MLEGWPQHRQSRRKDPGLEGRQEGRRGAPGRHTQLHLPGLPAHTAEEGLRDQHLWAYVQRTRITSSVLCIKNLIFLSPMDKSTGKSMAKLFLWDFAAVKPAPGLLFITLTFNLRILLPGTPSRETVTPTHKEPCQGCSCSKVLETADCPSGNKLQTLTFLHHQQLYLHSLNTFSSVQLLSHVRLFATP